MAYEYLPKSVADLIGKEMPARPGPVVCNQALIDHWVEVYEDANAVYTDPEFAEKSIFGGIIAPSGMMISTLHMPFYWTPTGENVMAGDDMVYFKVKRLLNVSGGIIMENGMDCYLPIRPGDRISSSDVLTNVSPLKETRLGIGHFITTDTIMRNQKGETVGKSTTIAFVYDPKNQPAKKEA